MTIDTHPLESQQTIGIYDRARSSMLQDMRSLWREAKRAKMAAETAAVQAEIAMQKIEELADRIRTGQLTPMEALAILGVEDDPDIEECFDPFPEPLPITPETACAASGGTLRYGISLSF